jgi:hypothetical protein
MDLFFSAKKVKFAKSGKKSKRQTERKIWAQRPILKFHKCG